VYRCESFYIPHFTHNQRVCGYSITAYALRTF